MDDNRQPESKPNRIIEIASGKCYALSFDDQVSLEEAIKTIARMPPGSILNINGKPEEFHVTEGIIFKPQPKEEE